MKCPVHLDTTMVLTDWKPPEGMDPELKQFECPKCHRIEYRKPVGLKLPRSHPPPNQ